MMTVDVIKFRQSLLNLLSNACKFTENGEVTLSVEQCRDAAGNWICWSVQDTGIGIAPENMHKLFQSFRRWIRRPRGNMAEPGWGCLSASASAR